jgi:superfamily II DNA/RNA helicase
MCPNRLPDPTLPYLCLTGGRAPRRQVDLIVCFDTSKSPIRNIQRMGRTGRTRPGRVVYILASGKEADDYQSNLMARTCRPLRSCHPPHCSRCWPVAELQS